MNIHKEENGKVSSKRVIGIVVVSISLIVFVALFFIKAAQISDTLLLGFFGGGMSSLVSTLFKQK